VRALIPILSCAFVLAVGTARADAESDAKDLFARGRELRAAGDCVGAAVLFRKALEIHPAGLGSLRNLAECEESLSRWASARRAWLDLMRALAVSPNAKYAGWIEDAEAGAARLAPRVARLTVTLTARGSNGDAPVDRASRVDVVLNGESLPAALLGTELDRDPGDYTIVAQGDDLVRPVEERVELSEGDSKAVTLQVELRPREAASESHVFRTSERGLWERKAGWIAVAVGGAAASAMAISIGVRQAALSDLETQCPGYRTSPCSSSVQPTVERGQLASTLSNVFGVGAVVGIAGGAALLLVPFPATSAHAGLTVEPRIGGFEMKGVF